MGGGDEKKKQETHQRIRKKGKAPDEGSEKSEKPEKLHQGDKWLRCEAVTCLSCLQTTHDIDRDLPPMVKLYLRWLRKHVRNGQECPSGAECYECFCVRRCNFELVEFSVLLDKRKEDRNTDNTFLAEAPLIMEACFDN